MPRTLQLIFDLHTDRLPPRRENALGLCREVLHGDNHLEGRAFGSQLQESRYMRRRSKDDGQLSMIDAGTRQHYARNNKTRSCSHKLWKDTRER